MQNDHWPDLMSKSLEPNVSALVGAIVSLVVATLAARLKLVESL